MKLTTLRVLYLCLPLSFPMFFEMGSTAFPQSNELAELNKKAQELYSAGQYTEARRARPIKH